MPFLILIPVFLLLAVLVVFASMRRRDTETAVGQLSRETRKRDRGEPTGHRRRRRSRHRPRGRAGRRHRAAPAGDREGRVVRAGRLRAARRRRHRRHPPAVLQPQHRAVHGPQPVGVRRRGARLPVAGRPRAASARRSASARSRDLQAQITAGKGFLYLAEGRMWLTELPVVRHREGQGGLQPAGAQLHGGRHRRRSTRSARTSAAACRRAPRRSGSSARATARSTTRPVRRRAALLPAAWIASPPRSSGGVLNVDTGTVIQGPPIGTNTTGQEAEGPHCVGGSAH